MLTSPAPLVIPLDATRSPLDALSRFVDLPDPALLESAAPGHPLSRYSFLTADPVDTIVATASEWPSVCERVRATFAAPPARVAQLPPFQGGWIGWFGYELGTAFDRIARHPNQPIPVADVAFDLHDWVIAWDHTQGEAWLVSTGIDARGMVDAPRARRRADAVLERWHAGAVAQPSRAPAETAAPRSDLDAAQYRAAVDQVIAYILAGDVFQVNIAQRFTTPFARDPLALYGDLARATPAPMAAFVRRREVSVVSASPERFVRLDMASRQVETRPIKGTRPRHADAARDAELAHELMTSDKDRAENVMIVDLMRNDLSRVCVPGSVRTPSLCALESHPTVHHLVSTVTGELRAGCDALDVLAATFPGGSITGAPKLRAMEIIGELEPVARGAYAGSIGWIGLDGAMDTSITIRTVTVADGVATFHAGGGITAQSIADNEYQESLDKARALIAAIVVP
jgi:para-aminobenzoate synthetase component 1